MKIFATLSLFAAGACAQMMGTTGMLGDAMMVNNNPSGATYVAMFESKGMGMGMGMNSLTGKVTAMSGKDGKGVSFNLELMGLPKEGGPFSEYNPGRGSGSA
jgi:hypothetical protein